MKFRPEQHIVGKVYDLTQENMQAMVLEIDRLRAENKLLEGTLYNRTVILNKYREKFSKYNIKGKK